MRLPGSLNSISRLTSASGTGGEGGRRAVKMDPLHKTLPYMVKPKPKTCITRTLIVT